MACQAAGRQKTALRKLAARAPLVTTPSPAHSEREFRMNTTILPETPSNVIDLAAERAQRRPQSTLERLDQLSAQVWGDIRSADTHVQTPATLSIGPRPALSKPGALSRNRMPRPIARPDGTQPFGNALPNYSNSPRKKCSPNCPNGSETLFPSTLNTRRPHRSGTRFFLTPFTQVRTKTTGFAPRSHDAA